MPTKQETYDYVINHLRVQNAVADDGDICMYRTPTGLKCAAGCLIPDDKYNKNWEYHTVTDSTGLRDLLKKLGYDIQFIRELQQIHDRKHPRFWENEFKTLAATHNLIYTPPTKQGPELCHTPS